MQLPYIIRMHVKSPSCRVVDTDAPSLQKRKKSTLIFQEADTCCQSAHSQNVRKMNALRGRDLKKKKEVREQWNLSPQKRNSSPFESPVQRK
ncbi:hypothetical protein CEXT_800081 [Caerostris extrusa]|uniref:Uncharacterized protein n=1 Tax=Caerostris extrusa TaxID=172846 RepID=A0AAV4ULS7_CAEEX|nr:hypothetical protein CEXT_800081 [Caerostris extrusa]